METPPPPTPQSNDATETPTQKQARLRRERREAKLKADGTSRLEQIAKVSGRQNLPDPPANIGQVPSDPDEVDLSTHPSASTTSRTPQQQQPFTNDPNAPPTEADIRALLRGGAPQPGVDAPPSQQGPGGGGGEEDPMMKMLSQFMGGMPQGENGEEGGGGIPPGLAAMLGGMPGGMPGMGGAGQGQGKKEDKYAYVWKIVHAIVAVGLGVWVCASSASASAAGGGFGRGQRGGGRPGGVVLETDQDGTVGQGGGAGGGGVNVFFAFATVELILQSSRFFLEKGDSGGQLGGWIGMGAGFLPEPYRGYVRLVGRYARIWGTVVEDAMVVVFVVGCVAWWKGAVG